MSGAPELDRARGLASGVLRNKHKGGRTVRDQRAVAPAERMDDIGILLRNGIAIFEAEILAQLGERIDRAIFMVLGRNARQILRPVAIALEIILGDARENASKAALDLGLLFPVAGAKQNVARFRRGSRRHFLRTYDKG